MSEPEIKRAAANSVMRIEICLPRVFPWKLRGGARPPTEVIKQSPSPYWRRTNETFPDTNRGYSYSVC